MKILELDDFPPGSGLPGGEINEQGWADRMLNKTHSRRKLTRRELRDLNIEIGFLEKLLERDPLYVDALQALGADYARRGDFANGLRIDECLAQLRPADPIVLYNLACSYSLTRQLRRAADTLNRAIEVGYKNFRLLASDPDLANLRRHAVFKRVRAKIHCHRTAAADQGKPDPC